MRICIFYTFHPAGEKLEKMFNPAVLKYGTDVTAGIRFKKSNQVESKLYPVASNCLGRIYNIVHSLKNVKDFNAYSANIFPLKNLLKKVLKDVAFIYLKIYNI